jgi:hypothetical protein
MRRTLAPVVIALTLAIAPAAVAHPIEGTIFGGTIRPDAETCAGVVCGSGNWDPFGDASYL